MSTDGSKPPSIAPRKPVDAGTGTEEAARPRPASAPVSGPNPPSTPASATDDGPSMTERLKKAARNAADTARNALPSGGTSDDVEIDEDDAPPPSPRKGSPQRPARMSAEPAPAAGPRRVRLAVSRVDPWSIMKLSFLLSVALGIMLVVATAVVWYTLDGLEVFTSLNATIAEITASETFFDLLEYAAFDRVISLATIIAVVDVVLLTALSTIGAFLYNIVAALVGGIHLTLTDD